jgi:nuclear pore complex protein Nup188
LLERSQTHSVRHDCCIIKRTPADKLRSWKAVCAIIRDANRERQRFEDPKRSNNALKLVQDFLFTKTAQSLLSRPWAPFKPPSELTKQSFESFTAPIKVTPSDVSTEIVEDARWLSSKAGIEELSSLRVVLLERQRRSEEYLCAYSYAEGIVGQPDAALSMSIGQSFDKTISISSKTSLSSFKSTNCRRQRYLEILLEEKTYVLKMSGMLMRMKNDSQWDMLGWIKQLGTDIELELPRHKDPHRIEYSALALGSLVNELDSRAMALANQDQWDCADESEYLNERWHQSLAAEVIHLLEIVLWELRSSSVFVAAEDVISWFEFANRYAYFVPPNIVRGNENFTISLCSNALVGIL